MKEELPKVNIFGIDSAARAVISIVGKSKPEKYELLVEGTSLLPVMNVQGVDGTQTFSNDIMQTEIVRFYHNILFFIFYLFLFVYLINFIFYIIKLII